MTKHTHRVTIGVMLALGALALAIGAGTLQSTPAEAAPGGGPGHGAMRGHGPAGPPPAEGVFAQHDANKDGKLTQDEVPEWAWERISRADANGDGAVTLEELEEGRPERGLGQGRMGPRGPMGPAGPGRIFQDIDKNEDGKITRDEVWEHFSAWDTNKDGAVTLEELEAARPERGPGQGQGQGRPTPEDIFARHDENTDGKLTEGEVPDWAWEHMSRADANEDGAVTLDELKAQRPERGLGEGHGQGRPTPEDIFARHDANKDGKLTEGEVPDWAWEHMARADANEDGAVTLDELKAERPERGLGEGQGRRGGQGRGGGFGRGPR